MVTDQNKRKMDEFISHLMQNSCFENEFFLKVEEHIIRFFTQNIPSLHKTLSTKEYFPNLEWAEIEKLFTKTIIDKSNKKLLPLMQTLISTKINFDFLNIKYKLNRPTDEYKNEILKLFFIESSRVELRPCFETVIKILNYDLIDKYVDEVFSLKSYTCFELEKVQKLKLSKEHISDYIKTALIISLIGFSKHSDDEDMGFVYKTTPQRINHNTSRMLKKYYPTIRDSYCKVLPSFPKDFIYEAIEMHLSILEYPEIPMSSRIGCLIFSLAKTFNPQQKVDRGAENYQKSWFKTQQKNYKFFGYDIKLIDEFYRIAAEKYW